MGRTWQSNIKIVFCTNIAENRLSYTLFPQFDESGVGFKDLFFDHYKFRIRRRIAKCVVAFSLLEAKNIALVKIPGYEIIERQVRMALFDRTSISGNIHRVEAIYNSLQERRWIFSTKTSLLFPKDDENTCFVRTNDVDINLSLLFELTFIVKKTDPKATSGLVELSAGWGVLPLFTADGGPVENKSYHIRLYPGSPLDKNVSAPGETENKGFFSGLFSGSSHPSLEVRVWKLGKRAMDEINQLPDSCVSFLSVLPILSFYRNLLAHTLYSPQIEGRNFSLLDPSLSLLPQIVDTNQLLQLACSIWDRKLKTMKSSDKKSFAILKTKFTETVMIVWPILYHNSNTSNAINVDAFKMAAVEQLQEEGALNFLTTNMENSYFTPFSTNELQYIYG